MNKFYKLNHFWFLLVIVFFAQSAAAQDNTDNWSIQWSHPKAFIKNHGQFDNRNNIPGSEILYAVDHGSTAIYFTPEGLTFRFYEIYRNPDRVKGDSAKPKRLAKQQYVHMHWLGANSDTEIIVEGMQMNYHTYSMLSSDRKDYYDLKNINGFEKLIYKNIYQGIDVVYEFHHETGIKYSLIIQPGADISQIAMKYFGDMEMSLTDEGNLNISTIFGKIIEHSPVTFYSQNHQEVIPSSFQLSNDNIVSFYLENPDLNKTIVIDPWVVTPVLPNSNGVWELDKDSLGNIYIIGGDMPMKLQKYNSAGALQWTYNTPWDTAGFWLGTLTTDQAGNSFITAGSSARLQKINTSGGMEYSVNGGAMDEYWMITFNCDHTKLIIGGTRLNPIVLANSHGVIFDININNGSVMNVQNVAGTRPGPLGIFDEPNEVRALTSSRNARYYYLTLEDVGCINQNFNICNNNEPIFHIWSDYYFSYKSENYRPDNGNAGIRAIRANDQFVYTQNGSHIEKRSLNDGAVITSVPITGGISTSTMGFNKPGNNGIAVDDCGNVYVGSGNRVIKYDANLNVISFQNTSFPVFDVVVSTNGDVVVVGTTGLPSATNRVGHIQSFNMQACPPFQLSCCLSGICPVDTFCHDDPAVQLIVEQTGGTFSGQGINPVTGVFNPSVAGPGTHSITYTLSCGSSSINIVVNFCDTLHVCKDSLGNLVVSGGLAPYEWQEWLPAQTTPITNQATCVACGYTWVPFLNQCLDGIIPVTTCTTPAGWSTFATGLVVAPPTNWPVQVTDNSSNSVILTDYTSIPDCLPCNMFNISISNLVNVSCFGGTDGSLSVSTTGGLNPYSYTLLQGSTVIANYNNVTGTQNFTGLSAGTYTLNVLDNDNCPGTITFTITQPPQIHAGTPVVTNASCGISDGTATFNPSGGTPGYTFIWSTVPQQITQTASNLPAGTYIVTITDNNGCTATASATIISPDSPVVSLSSTDASCGNADGTATAAVTGGTPPYSYTWNTNPVQTGSTIQNIPSGNYTVTVTDSQNCTASANVTINDTGVPSISLSVTDATCGFSDGSISADVTGGTPPYSYFWNTTPPQTAGFLDDIPSGIYEVTVTDDLGCTASASAIVIDLGAPLIIVSSTNAICGDNSGTITLTITGGEPPYFIEWSTGDSGSSVNNLTAGTYTYTVTDADNCTQTGEVIIYNVEINCNPPHVYVPNIFSPNNDGENDILFVRGEGIASLEFIIYSRWGQKIFESTHINKGWDGAYKNKPVQSGVYAYFLKVFFYNGEEYKQHGTVTLVR
jgi:gliding motility-associated-like protein